MMTIKRLKQICESLCSTGHGNQPVTILTRFCPMDKTFPIDEEYVLGGKELALYVSELKDYNYCEGYSDGVKSMERRVNRMKSVCCKECKHYINGACSRNEGECEFTWTTPVSY